MEEGKVAVGGSGTAIGSYDDALRFIGYVGPMIKAGAPLDLPIMYAHLALLENDNPIYWDEGLVILHWGAPVAPSSLLVAVFFPLRWKRNQHEIGLLARTLVPLPGTSMINTGTEETFFRPLRVGDWLSCQETVVHISTEESTSVGVGHFVTTRMDYYDAEGERIAERANTVLRFTPKNAEDSNEG